MIQIYSETISIILKFDKYYTLEFEMNNDEPIHHELNENSLEEKLRSNSWIKRKEAYERLLYLFQ